MSASSAQSICIHEERITDFFGESACQYQGSAPLTEHCTFIIFLNRSGSSLLANYLTASGQFFGGDENLNWDTVIETSKRKGFESFHDYMAFLTQRDKWNKNKRFLIKSATSQLQMLSRFGYLPSIAPKLISFVSQDATSPLRRSHYRSLARPRNGRAFKKGTDRNRLSSLKQLTASVRV